MRRGLKSFGKRMVEEMNELGMIVDVSHLSDGGFWDVAKIATKPLVASHSNAKEVCKHPRNLSREQFEAIKNSGGLVGLNFYKAFLNDVPEKACMEDVIRHAEYFLSLGGEDVLSLGGDWDGADLPDDMPGLAAIPDLYELFLRKNYGESLVQKLFYGNAASFFQRENLL